MYETLNHILFGWYPYLCLTVFLVGSWLRFDREQYTWRSGSSQLLRRRQLMWGSNLFHVGILIVFLGHFVGLLTPIWMFDAIGISHGFKQWMAIIVGGVAGLACLIGITLLVHRRLFDARIRKTSSFGDIAVLLLLYARLGKREAAFKLDYHEVRVDLVFFLAAYAMALGCGFVVSRPVHYLAAVLLIASYVYYMRLKFSGAPGGESEMEPLIFAPRQAVPSYGLIGLQAVVGLAGLAGGAHLFVTAARSIAEILEVSPLILALLIAPLATELPEMSNSFLWLYRKKDRLAVGNVTGAMVFQGTFPVSIGLVGTDWSLAPSAMTTMGLALLAVGAAALQLLWGGHWRPWLLGGGVVLYLGYTASLYFYGF